MHIAIDPQSCQTAEEDVWYCFRLILGREPNETEWRAHTAHYVGQELSAVVASYLTSAEFKSRNLLNLSRDDLQLVQLPRFQIYASPSDVAVGHTIIEAKSYEPHVSAQVEAILAARGPGAVAVDVGANIGYFSLLAASLVGPQGKVIAFEPMAANAQLVQCSCLANEFANVDIRLMALAERRQLVFLDESGSNASIAAIKDAKPSNRMTVYASTLDEELPDLERLDLLKIDIEGAEYLALKGGQRLLAQHRPVIVLEFTPLALPQLSGVTADAFLEFILYLGYRIALIEEDGSLEDYTRCPLALVEKCASEHRQHVDLLMEPA